MSQPVLGDKGTPAATLWCSLRFAEAANNNAIPPDTTQRCVWGQEGLTSPSMPQNRCRTAYGVRKAQLCLASPNQLPPSPAVTKFRPRREGPSPQPAGTAWVGARRCSTRRAAEATSWWQRGFGRAALGCLCPGNGKHEN